MVYCNMKDLNDMIEVGCEEVFAEDMGPADWAGQGCFQPDTGERAYNPPIELPVGRCEDAPCCGCCSADGSMVRGAFNGSNWHEWGG